MSNTELFEELHAQFVASQRKLSCLHSRKADQLEHVKMKELYIKRFELFLNARFDESLVALNDEIENIEEGIRASDLAELRLLAFDEAFVPRDGSQPKIAGREQWTKKMQNLLGKFENKHLNGNIEADYCFHIYDLLSKLRENAIMDVIADGEMERNSVEEAFIQEAPESVLRQIIRQYIRRKGSDERAKEASRGYSTMDKNALMTLVRQMFTKEELNQELANMM